MPRSHRRHDAPPPAEPAAARPTPPRGALRTAFPALAAALSHVPDPPPAVDAQGPRPAPVLLDATLAALLDVLEASGIAAALLDHTLAVRRTTDPLARLLAADGADGSLWESARRLAARARADVATGGAGPLAGQTSGELRSATARYRLTVGVLPPAQPTASWASGHLLLVVDRIERPRPATVAEALHAHFGLTPREVEVAGHAIAGESTRRIAERLALSPHTVRHHLERVYARLDVHSRAALATRVAALASES